MFCDFCYVSDDTFKEGLSVICYKLHIDTLLIDLDSRLKRIISFTAFSYTLACIDFYQPSMPVCFRGSCTGSSSCNSGNLQAFYLIFHSGLYTCFVYSHAWLCIDFTSTNTECIFDNLNLIIFGNFALSLFIMLYKGNYSVSLLDLYKLFK